MLSKKPDTAIKSTEQLKPMLLKPIIGKDNS